MFSTHCICMLWGNLCDLVVPCELGRFIKVLERITLECHAMLWGISYCNETKYRNTLLLWTLRNDLFCNQSVKKKGGCWAENIDVPTSLHTKTHTFSSQVISSNPCSDCRLPFRLSFGPQMQRIEVIIPRSSWHPPVHGLSLGLIIVFPTFMPVPTPIVSFMYSKHPYCCV